MEALANRQDTRVEDQDKSRSVCEEGEQGLLSLSSLLAMDRVRP